MRALRPLSSGALAVLFAVALGSGAPALSGCDSTEPCEAGGEVSVVDLTPAGTRLGVDRVGPGTCVTVDYVGRLPDGGTFDQNTAGDRGSSGPLRFTYVNRDRVTVSGGGGGLILGFSRGVEGQRAGETRRITVPASLAYGTQRREASRPEFVSIPSCATLVFDITVTNVTPDTRAC